MRNNFGESRQQKVQSYLNENALYNPRREVPAWNKICQFLVTLRSSWVLNL